MRVTEDKPLTVKQTKFAAAVAEGKPKTVARRENYSENPKYPKATSRRASELAAKPHVAAEIRRLTWLSCPPADDVRGMREHSIRVLSDLSRTAVSEEVRLKSALALFRIAETTRAASDPRTDDAAQDRLLASLRKLYVQVQGQAARGGDGDTPDIGPVIPLPEDEPIDITLLAEPVPAPPAAEPPAAAPISDQPVRNP
jgi:hypothetical protein